MTHAWPTNLQSLGPIARSFVSWGTLLLTEFYGSQTKRPITAVETMQSISSLHAQEYDDFVCSMNCELESIISDVVDALQEGPSGVQSSVLWSPVLEFIAILWMPKFRNNSQGVPGVSLDLCNFPQSSIYDLYKYIGWKSRRLLKYIKKIVPPILEDQYSIFLKEKTTDLSEVPLFFS